MGLVPGKAKDGAGGNEANDNMKTTTMWNPNTGGLDARLRNDNKQ